MKKVWTKVENWYDNLIFKLRNLRGDVISFFNGIRRWFSYYKVISRIYDFDYSSILEVERKQIIRVRDSIYKYRNHMYWERDVERMNLALKLLDIIREDGCAELIGDPFGNVRADRGNSKWVLNIYVNTRNARRFVPKWDLDMIDDSGIGPIIKDSLRVEKAWQLYHKLRVYYLRTWWD